MIEFIITILVIAGYMMFYVMVGIIMYAAIKVWKHEQQKKNQNNTAAELQPPIL